MADTADVVSALEDITAWLAMDPSADQSSQYYTTILKYFPVEADARSFALRLLIHYVGDVHQPLHAVAEVDSTYPSGDHGGNLETLPSVCGANNLHAMWDSVAYNYCGNPITVSIKTRHPYFFSPLPTLIGLGTPTKQKRCAKHTLSLAVRYTTATSKNGLMRALSWQNYTSIQVG